MFRWIKQVPSVVLFLSLASLFMDISGEGIYPILPLFLTEVLGTSVVLVGSLEGAAEATASLVKFLMGFWSDRSHKQEPFVLAGYSISVIARTCLGWVTHPFQAIAIRMMDRGGKGVREAPRDSWLSSYASAGNRAKVFTFNRAMDHTGAMIGPIVAAGFLWIWPRHYRSLFFFMFIPGALALVCVLLAQAKQRGNLVGKADRKKGEKKTEQRSVPSAAISGSHSFDPRFVRYLFLVALITAASATDVFLLLKLKEVGIGDAMIPLFWAYLHFIKMGSSFWVGSFADRLGHRRSIVLGWMVAGAAFGGFALSKSLLSTLICYSIVGLYYGLSEGPEKAFISDLSPQGRQGTAFGYFHLTIGLVSFPSSWWFGWIWKRYSSSSAFWWASALCWISAAGLGLLRATDQLPRNGQKPFDLQ